ncbi:MAG TPA: hypothetical protein VKZ53_11435 [Candidatus Angelobacter sp.]|nr:hypothetical protein [Candidatus Angelobacter sp.]
MGLMDAKEYDPRPAERIKRLLLIGVPLLIAVLIFIWKFWYWPEEHVVNNFFTAIEAKNFDQAYALYNSDPAWKQHPEKYKDYTYNQFALDWGPSGDYGPITTHRVECSTELPKKDYQSASGVIVVVRINNRAETKSLWVEKKSKTISLSPREAIC